ncbi:MAG: hypothetical protein U1D30_09320 [Planctomycetota bacterium]
MSGEFEGQGKAATITAVVVVGLGVLLILPGIGILYFLIMIPVLIALARSPGIQSPGPGSNVELGMPPAMVRADREDFAASYVDRPISILLQVGMVVFILIASFIAFCATCTASAIAGLVASDAVGASSESLLGVFMVAVLLVSLASAVLVFVLLFRLLVIKKKKKPFTAEDLPSRQRE